MPLPVLIFSDALAPVGFEELFVFTEPLTLEPLTGGAAAAVDMEEETEVVVEVWERLPGVREERSSQGGEPPTQ